MINGLQGDFVSSWKKSPQGLKPQRLVGSYGAAEAAPLQSKPKNLSTAKAVSLPNPYAGAEAAPHQSNPQNLSPTEAARITLVPFPFGFHD
jgi:hypothetical protein